MFEHRAAPLLSRVRFLKRQLRFMLFASVLIAFSLLLGIWGYMSLAGLGFVDALLNAAMIMGGMGPVDVLHDDAAKIFAALYALYSGIALLGVVAVMLAPLVHRMLHALHLADEAADTDA